jgi:transglutaminase-like putative cysteine protease
MTRIDFLKISALFGLTTIYGNKSSRSFPPKRKFHIKYQFKITNDKNKHPLELWNPLPLNSSYQKVVNLTFNGNYQTFQQTNQNSYNANTFYAKWDKSTKTNILNIDMEVETLSRNIPISLIKKASFKNAIIPENEKIFLDPTEHIPTKGIVKKLANRITRGLIDRFDKVQAIYYWCTLHTFRDSQVVGCGTGDVGAMILRDEVEYLYNNGYYGGKCTDISSLFTSLVRASGTPAREVFGIRLGKSYYSKALGKSKNNFSDISSSQHCRAEYYIPSLGWVPTDPADISKLILIEKLKYTDKKVRVLNDDYLHSWEMNWMGFNYGRDFNLYPRQKKSSLNMFGYPYAQINNKTFNFYSPRDFIYKITSQELT